MEVSDLKSTFGGNYMRSANFPNAYFDFNKCYWKLEVTHTEFSQHDFLNLIYCAEILDDGEACFYLAREFDTWFINLQPRSYTSEGEEKPAIRAWAKRALAWRSFADYLYRKAIHKGYDEAAMHLAFLCQDLHLSDERLWWEHAVHQCDDKTAMGELASWFLRSKNKDIDRSIYWFQQAFQKDGPYIDAMEYVDALKERGTPQDICEAIAVLAMLVDGESTLSNDLTDSSEMPPWIDPKEAEKEIASIMPESYCHSELFAEDWFTLYYYSEETFYLTPLHLALANEYSAEDQPGRDLVKAEFWCFQSLYSASSYQREVLEDLDQILAELAFKKPDQYSVALKDCRVFIELNEMYGTDVSVEGESPSYDDWRLALDTACISIGSELAKELLARGERFLAKNCYLSVLFLPEGVEYNPKQIEAIEVLAEEFFSEDDEVLDDLFEESEKRGWPVNDCLNLQENRQKERYAASWSPNRPWGNRLAKLIKEAGISNEDKAKTVLNVMEIDHSAYFRIG